MVSALPGTNYEDGMAKKCGVKNTGFDKEYAPATVRESSSYPNLLTHFFLTGQIGFRKGRYLISDFRFQFLGWFGDFFGQRFFLVY